MGRLVDVGGLVGGNKRSRRIIMTIAMTLDLFEQVPIGQIIKNDKIYLQFLALPSENYSCPPPRSPFATL